MSIEVLLATEAGAVRRAAEALADGDIVAVPTDTVYAIVCLLGNEEAIERMYAVKHFSPSKRLSILVADIASASAVRMIGDGNVLIWRNLPGDC